MGYLLRILTFLAVLMAGALPLAAFDGPTQSKADSKKATASGSEAKKADAAAAEKDKKAADDTASRLLEAGIKAYQAGNMNQAIRAFDTALRGGGLANQQIARALYYRGLSYRKKGKPGLAISDLTSAAWLKDGLSPSEKQEAMSNRVAAYREAGIADVPDVDQSPALANPGWQTAMSGSKAPSAGSSAAPPAPPAPAPVQTSSGSSSGGGVGGFFDSITSLFGGGSSSSTASQDEVTTSSIAHSPEAAATWQTTEATTASPPPPARPAPQAAPPPPAAPQAAAPPPQAPTKAAALPWASPSAPPSAPRAAPSPQAAAPPPRPAPAEPQAGTAGFVTQVATAPPSRAETPAATAAEPTGKFHVQVAAVRTRSEAYAVAVRLVSQHGSELGGRKPLVDDTVIGSMGTFYRVRLGPYASAKEPQDLCGSLRSSGFDCLVVTQ
jgi:hypothetical protein